MNSNFSTISVNEPFALYNTKKDGDSVKFFFDKNMTPHFMIINSLRNPQVIDEQVFDAKLEFSLAVVKGIIVISMRPLKGYFSGYYVQWSEMFFTSGLIPVSHFQSILNQCNQNHNLHFSCVMVLVNSSTNIVKKLRIISLNSEFIGKLAEVAIANRKTVEEQEEILRENNILSLPIGEIASKYSIKRTIAGTDFCN